MKESDLSIIHETAIKIAELLGLEKSYATLTLLEKIENMNALLQLVKYIYTSYDVLIISFSLSLTFSYVFNLHRYTVSYLAVITLKI